MQVYFVNYDEIKKEISEIIEKKQNPSVSDAAFPPQLRETKGEIWLYSSDYSDIL
jgi:hypothetical protein